MHPSAVHLDSTEGGAGRRWRAVSDSVRWFEVKGVAHVVRRGELGRKRCRAPGIMSTDIAVEHTAQKVLNEVPSITCCLSLSFGLDLHESLSFYVCCREDWKGSAVIWQGCLRKWRRWCYRHLCANLEKISRVQSIHMRAYMHAYMRYTKELPECTVFIRLFGQGCGHGVCQRQRQSTRSS